MHRLTHGEGVLANLLICWKCATGFTTKPFFKVEFLHEVNLLPNGACKLQCVILLNRVP